jgi:hypothetical protein
MEALKKVSLFTLASLYYADKCLQGYLDRYREEMLKLVCFHFYAFVHQVFEIMQITEHAASFRGQPRDLARQRIADYDLYKDIDNDNPPGNQLEAYSIIAARVKLLLEEEYLYGGEDSQVCNLLSIDSQLTSCWS